MGVGKAQNRRQRRSKRGPTQLAFRLIGWGGKRKGAGRKPKGSRAGVSHRKRLQFNGKAYPVHVTLRVGSDISSLRIPEVYSVVRTALKKGAEYKGFRLIHFSVQRDHLHLLCEAASGALCLARGVQGLKRQTRRVRSERSERRQEGRLCRPRNL